MCSFVEGIKTEGFNSFLAPAASMMEMKVFHCTTVFEPILSSRATRIGDWLIIEYTAEFGIRNDVLVISPASFDCQASLWASRWRAHMQDVLLLLVLRFVDLLLIELLSKVCLHFMFGDALQRGLL